MCVQSREELGFGRVTPFTHCVRCHTMADLIQILNQRDRNEEQGGPNSTCKMLDSVLTVYIDLFCSVVLRILVKHQPVKKILCKKIVSLYF
jgi:hypothetical protein